MQGHHSRSLSVNDLHELKRSRDAAANGGTVPVLKKEHSRTASLGMEAV